MARVALVTGANRGIGKAIAEGLSRSGDIKVIIGCRNWNDGRAVAEALPGKAVAAPLDLGDRDALRAQARAINVQHGPVDVLVNNAGVLVEGDVFDVSDAGFDDALRVNLLGPLDLIRAFAPSMIERGYGRVVNVSTGWASFGEGLEGPIAYSVTKAALNALTSAVSHGLPPNVKVNAMCPGWVRTRMGGDDATRSPEEGADTAVWLATLPDDGPNGGFFRDRQPIAW